MMQTCFTAGRFNRSPFGSTAASGVTLSAATLSVAVLSVATLLVATSANAQGTEDYGPWPQRASGRTGTGAPDRVETDRGGEAPVGGTGGVVAGRILDWPESGGSFFFDDFVGVTSNIIAFWSINTLNPPRGWFYATNFPDAEVAHAPDVQHISEVTDASVFDYEDDWSTGPVNTGEFVFYRNLTTGFYAAFRVDDIRAGDPVEVADVTWYLQEDGSPDFSSFVFFDNFESGDTSYWAVTVPGP